MKVAITGASGFIGSHLAVAYQQSGHEVLCVGRRAGPVGEHLPWDAQTRRLPALAVDLVVHAAADTSDRLSLAQARKINTNPAFDLARRGIPVVFISSSSVYGKKPVSPASETDPLGQGGFDSNYARSKAEADQELAYHGAWVLRPRAVYGEGDPTLLPRLLTRVRGAKLVLPGEDVLTSLTDVRLLAQAAVDCWNWPTGIYNIADKEPVSRDEAAKKAVSEALGREVEVAHAPVWLARGLARTGPLARKLDITDYAISQASVSLVLDVSKAAGQGLYAEPAQAKMPPGRES